jgi:hypothetical protein
LVDYSLFKKYCATAEQEQKYRFFDNTVELSIIPYFLSAFISSVLFSSAIKIKTSPAKPAFFAPQASFFSCFAGWLVGRFPKHIKAFTRFFFYRFFLGYLKDVDSSCRIE